MVENNSRYCKQDFKLCLVYEQVGGEICYRIAVEPSIASQRGKWWNCEVLTCAVRSGYTLTNYQGWHGLDWNVYACVISNLGLKNRMNKQSRELGSRSEQSRVNRSQQIRVEVAVHMKITIYFRKTKITDMWLSKGHDQNKSTDTDVSWLWSRNLQPMRSTSMSTSNYIFSSKWRFFRNPSGINEMLLRMRRL